MLTKISKNQKRGHVHERLPGGIKKNFGNITLPVKMNNNSISFRTGIGPLPTFFFNTINDGILTFHIRKP